MTRAARCWPAAALLLAAGACERTTPAATAPPGEPVPGITDAQRREFVAGQALFTRAFSPAEGLGPTFNENRCASCHDLPTTGGSGADPVRKVTRFADGRCDPLVEHGGDMLQSQITDALHARGFTVEGVPALANAVTGVMPPPLFGAGFIDAIPDAAILAYADPDDADGDGISGRAGVAAGERLGRFGWKASFATVRDFVENALLTEMGLTTAGFPHESPIGAEPLPEGSDPAADPEIDADLVDLLTAYVRLLAPPAIDSAAAADPSARTGQTIFDRLGCAACHRPALPAADSAPAPIGGRTLALYSDLLLHDMGPENAGICAASAGPTEWRTAPLMGLRFRLSFLHDGRASSAEAAIRAHGGEATRARDAFLVLTDADRAALLRFLGSL
jgi:CxxC motif-containing protein (DUF1111 family)